MADAFDGANLIMSCPLGQVISVVSANYGSLDGSTCTPVDYTNFMKGACNGESNVNLKVSTMLTGSSTCGVSIYNNKLSVSYLCVAPTSRLLEL